LKQLEDYTTLNFHRSRYGAGEAVEKLNLEYA
jgi:hypothetical protein